MTRHTSFLPAIYGFRRLCLWWLPVLCVAALMPLAAVTMPLYERQLFDDVIGAGRLDLLPRTIGTYAALWLAVLLAQQLISIALAYFTERYLRDLRQRVFTH